MSGVRATATGSERQREYAERIAERERADLAAVLATESGRRVVFRLLDGAGLYRVTFRTSSEGAFLEGRRSLGLEWFAAIRADHHAAWLTMEAEAARLAATDAAVLAAITNESDDDA